MAKIAVYALIVVVWLDLSMAVYSVADAPPPNHYLAVLKKDSDVQLKEVTAGYKITIMKGIPGTHKVIACEPDFVTLTDITGINTIRIHKNAVLSITEVKLK